MMKLQIVVRMKRGGKDGGRPSKGDENRTARSPFLHGGRMGNWFVEDRLVAADTVRGH